MLTVNLTQLDAAFNHQSTVQALLMIGCDDSSYLDCFWWLTTAAVTVNLMNGWLNWLIIGVWINNDPVDVDWRIRALRNWRSRCRWVVRRQPVLCLPSSGMRMITWRSTTASRCTTRFRVRNPNEITGTSRASWANRFTRPPIRTTFP